MRNRSEEARLGLHAAGAEQDLPAPRGERGRDSTTIGTPRRSPTAARARIDASTSCSGIMCSMYPTASTGSTKRSTSRAREQRSRRAATARWPSVAAKRRRGVIGGGRELRLASAAGTVARAARALARSCLPEPRECAARGTPPKLPVLARRAIDRLSLTFTVLHVRPRRAHPWTTRLTPAESPSPHSNPPDAADARRTRIVLSTMLVVYVIAVAALIATDQIGMRSGRRWSCPALAIAAAGDRDACARSVRDWAVFLGAVMLFDAGRGVVFGIITISSCPCTWRTRSTPSARSSASRC